MSAIRISRIVRPTDLRCILVDCSYDITLQNLTSRVSMDIIKKLDGLIVADADAVVKNLHIFLGKTSPTYILRVEPEVLRSSDPKANVEETVIKALQMNFSAIISTFTIGFEDESIDSNNMKLITMLSDVCYDYGLPLIVESMPFGERVSSENYGESVGLAARMAEEVGASIVVVPPLKTLEDLKKVRESIKAHMLLIDPSSKLVVERSLRSLPEILSDAFNIGLNGIVLSSSLALNEPAKILLDILSTVHSGG
ncbi:MAG: hypothetical protein QXU47_05290 [Candidatus Bathyarchaeia archaeon]